MKAKGKTDASGAPSPEGGWSTQILSVADALVVPATVPDMIQPMGVFDAEGHYLPQAVLWRGRALMVEPERPEPTERLAGRWIWAGVLLNHFGHFLVESTSRLWAIDSVAGPVDGIVFTSKREAADEEGEIGMQPYHRQFFDLLGIDLPIRILTQPTVVECLEVPGQGFGIGPIASGTPAFRDFIHARFAKDIPAEGAEKIYISRSALGATRGGILEETRIEAALQEAGYRVFHPQKHSLTEQIAQYKAARQVVALDGSALHLMAMLGRADQQVALIKRRDSHASDSIIRHLADFMGRAPVVIDVIVQDWVRSDRKRADRHSVGQLDFAALGQKLVAEGFLHADAVMQALSPDQAQAAVQEVEQKLKRGKLTFRPAPRGEPVPLVAEAPGKTPKGEARAKTAPDPNAPPKLKGAERREARMARRAEKASAGDAS